MRAIGLLAATAMAGAAGLAPALAQDDLGYGGWDLLPSPGDVAFGKGKGAAGACGQDAIGPVGTEVQATYARQGRCENYSNNDFRDFYLDMRVADVKAGRRESGSEGVGDYETVANYFNYHGETWWDGRYSPGYQETARLAGQVPPGLTAHYAGTGSATVPVAAQPPSPCPGHLPSDPLEARVLALLSTGAACGLHTPERYWAFERAVPARQRYAVNYLAWVAERPLLEPDVAEAAEARALAGVSTREADAPSGTLGACGVSVDRVPAGAQADLAGTPSGCADLAALLSAASD